MSDLYDRYLDLLLAANQTMNLTRIVDRSAARTQHVEDSLTLLPFFPTAPFRLADVGSGGGVPGIVLAIARPDAAITLIESTKKKAAFLQQCVAQLQLGNVSVIDQRVELVAQDPKTRERFDVVVARAVARLVWLAEWCLPLAKVGGKFLAMKGPKVHDELPEAKRAIKLLGGGEPALHLTNLPGAEQHLIVELRKISRSAKSYPRDPTVAKNKPIG